MQQRAIEEMVQCSTRWAKVQTIKRRSRGRQKVAAKSCRLACLKGFVA